MTLALLLIPLAGGVAGFLLRDRRMLSWLWLVVALTHGCLTGLCWVRTPAPALGGWLALDTPGLVFLSVTSLLFLAAAVYGPGYLAAAAEESGGSARGSTARGAAPVFVSCQLLFLAAMTLVTMSRHFGLLWVAIEATTLASAPLILHHRTATSVEATWKYLLVCSVGIALALLGTFFLGAAAAVAGPVPLVLDRMLELGPAFNPQWLKAALVLMVVGYGTKMGLVPMHTWLPDAHSEAPSVVSALLSGALLNCAFLGLLRVHQVCAAAGLGAVSRELFVVFGVVSVLVAGAFILGQRDFKRVLAYSSVEHMGLLALGVGLGGTACAGAMFHAVFHSLAKAGLFFVAGILLNAYGTKNIERVGGVLRVMPWVGVLWICGLLAAAGMPPFGTFFSELMLVRGALEAGQLPVAVLALLGLSVAFIGLVTVFQRTAQGVSTPVAGGIPASGWTRLLLLGPPTVLLALVLVLGLCMPGPVRSALMAAAAMIDGR